LFDLVELTQKLLPLIKKSDSRRIPLMELYAADGRMQQLPQK
jgi:hypothetical protein